MNKQEERKFHWKAFVIALIVFSIIMFISLIGTLGYEEGIGPDYFTTPSYAMFLVLRYPFVVWLEDNQLWNLFLVGIALNVIFYSLIIERVYYFVYYKEMNKQEGDLKA